MARIPHELILQQQITTSETFIGFLLFICFLSILIFVVDSNGSTITIQHLLLKKTNIRKVSRYIKGNETIQAASRVIFESLEVPQLYA